MMTDRELMQQALDGWDSRGGFPILAKAMEAIRERLAQQEQEPSARLTCEELGYVPLSDDGKSVYIDGFGLVPLAQPEQEPVASVGSLNEFSAMELVRRGFALTDHLYAAPPQRKPEQKPVPWESFFNRYCPWLEQPEQEPVQFKCTVIDDVHPNGIPLEQWPSPPQRTWVDLTDEEIEACRQKGYLHSGLNAPFDFDRAAGAVLAKAKEKNT